MRNAVAALVCLLATTPAFATPMTHTLRAPYAPGEVLVAFAPGTTQGLRAGAFSVRGVALAATLARYGLAHAEDLQPTATASERTADVVRLRSDLAGFDPVAAAAELRAQPGVLAASPNLYLHLDLTPNDPWLSYQWHLGNSAAAIHAPTGWTQTTGNTGVLIAILDTGVDLQHADLVANIWTNTLEIPDNGLDDDHDNYADDVHGWDFGDGDNDPNPEPIIDPSSGVDVAWHGTFVAGLASGATNNGIGIAGVAWNCKIMPLKIVDYYGNLALSYAVSAMDYAITKHATVINMSFGTSDTTARGIFQSLVNRAITAGTVCVASAGNYGVDTAMYPAACDSVLAVASTNVNNLRSTWSNWGWYVDLAAPGEGMWSTIARNYQYDDWSLYCYAQYFGFDGMHAYMENDGTSFAAPVVSGAVALLHSRLPNLTPVQEMQRLIQTGDVKIYDNPIGPKLNLANLLTYPADVAPIAAGPLALAAPAPNPAAREASLAFTLPRAGTARLAIFDAAGRTCRVLADGARPAGAQGVRWDLCDDTGRAVAPGLYFARLVTTEGERVQRIAVVR